MDMTGFSIDNIFSINDAIFFEIVISGTECVSVKTWIDPNSIVVQDALTYVMSCHNGFEVYDKSKGPESGVRNLTRDEYDAVIKFVKRSLNVAQAMDDDDIGSSGGVNLLL